MDIRHLQTLRAVVDAGTFTGAAESLFLTQSAVSVQIRQLEDAVGATLFTRMSSGVRATHAGEVLYRYAGRILAVADEAKRELAALEDGRGQTVRVATNDVCAFLVSMPITRFPRQHPETDIAIFEGSTDAALSRVERGDADLAVVVTLASPPREGTTCTTLLPLELVAMAPPGHPVLRDGPVSIAELANYPLALYESGNLLRTLVATVLDEQGLRPRVLFESNWLNSLVRAVEAGIGLAIAPRLAITEEIRAGRIVTAGVPELAHRLTVRLVTTNEPRRQSVQDLIDDIEANAIELAQVSDPPMPF